MSKGLQCGHKETIGKSPLTDISQGSLIRPQILELEKLWCCLIVTKPIDPPTIPLCGLCLASLYLNICWRLESPSFQHKMEWKTYSQKDSTLSTLWVNWSKPIILFFSCNIPLANLSPHKLLLTRPT